MTTSNPTLKTYQERSAEALAFARDLYAQNPDWVTFFREVMGINGVLRAMFPAGPDSAFRKSAAFAEIQEMLTTLRNRQEAGKERTRVITVRLPASLHESLLLESKELKTSMNQLCIGKLLRAEPRSEEAAA